jgi:hypothetical protein
MIIRVMRGVRVITLSIFLTFEDIRGGSVIIRLREISCFMLSVHRLSLLSVPKYL